MVLGVLGLVDLRWSANSCKLSTRCRLAMDFFTGVAELAEWWWFENSRVCLYYFLVDFMPVRFPPAGVCPWVREGA